MVKTCYSHNSKPSDGPMRYRIVAKRAKAVEWFIIVAEGSPVALCQPKNSVFSNEVHTIDRIWNHCTTSMQRKNSTKIRMK